MSRAFRSSLGDEKASTKFRQNEIKRFEDGEQMDGVKRKREGEKGECPCRKRGEAASERMECGAMAGLSASRTLRLAGVDEKTQCD